MRDRQSREGTVIRQSGTILLALGVAAGIAGLSHGMGWGQATGAAAPAPAPSSDSAGTTTLQVFSRETVVDVTVMDAKGGPIRNLKASDFVIEEDGKPQPIRGFQEYGKDTPPVERVPPKLPPDVYTNVQPQPTTSAVNILLLDALNTAPADQMFMKQESMRYLKSMPKGTRVAVLGLSTRLRILQGFTADPAVLIAAVDSKKNRALPSPFIDNDTGETIDSLMDVVDDGTAASLAEFENEQATDQQEMRNRMTLEALDQIAAYVAGIKGRKNLIWFSSGIPLNIFPDIAPGSQATGTNGFQGMEDFTKDVRKTTDLLAAAEVAVYPLDARGLFNDPGNSAAAPETGLSQQAIAKKAQKDAAAKLKFAQKTAQEHLSLEAVAEATGGIAFYNTNDLKTAVGKAIDNGANYYTLSYVPPTLAFDGRHHSINVKVDRPGVRVLYRNGYNADDIAQNAITPELTLATTAPEPYGNNMQASMERGVPTSSQLLFTVRVDPLTDTVNPPGTKVQGTLDPKLQGKPLRRYEFRFSMPGRQISFTDAPDGMHKGSLEFDVAAYDVYGKLITDLSQSIDLPLTADRYKQLQGSPFGVVQQLDLPPGEMFVRIGILDRVSDKVGTTEIPLTVNKKSVPATGGKGGN
jgi:VWFA-related protein